MRSEAKIGKALQLLRQTANLTQEDFELVSSRTYISTVERGLKSPTLGKIDQLAHVLGVHPLALLTLAYIDKLTPKEVERTTSAVCAQLVEILSER